MTQVCGGSLAGGTDIERFMTSYVTYVTYVTCASSLYEFGRNMHFIGV